MNISWKWLGEFVDLTGITPEEAADKLTMSGLEVAGVTSTMAPGLEKVITARITAQEKHPQADKLSLCTVDDGRQTYTIVCGASNMKAGDHVALAPVGTKLPNGLQIKKSKIRGVVSAGMLCSAAELGLEEESTGILILPPDTPLGEPVFSCLGLDDHVLEIEITPNRGDCLSVIGVAREIAALYERRFSYPAPKVSGGEPPTPELITIDIEDPELCPRYVGRIARELVIAESPLWLQQRLAAAGVRAINNIVDITNYVMLETGQPLHAFDLERVRDRRIIVRRAGGDREFTTLDDVKRQLDPDTLMICDGQGPVAIAGIMGGQNSEITATTTQVLIESAFFQPASIRRSSRLLGLATEASYRFERGVDPEGCGLAADRAVALLVELAQAQPAGGRLDANPRPYQAPEVTIRTDYCNRLLGIELEPAAIENILARLQLQPRETTPGTFTTRIPGYRFDLEREADLIEEVARLYGYHHLPTTLPLIRERGGGSADDSLLAAVKELAVAYGYCEAVNYSFMDPKALDMLGIPAGDERRRLVQLRNPLNEEMSAMRTTLLPALLHNLSTNFRASCRNIRLFELGKIFIAVEGEKLPDERLCLAGAATGTRYREHFAAPEANIDFYDLKGFIEELAAFFHLDFAFDRQGIELYHHPGRAAAIMLGERQIGSLGQLHPDISDYLDINQEIFVFELALPSLLAAAGRRPVFQALPRYPASYRDLAIVVDRQLPAAELVRTIREVSKLIAAVEIFDVYEGNQIPADKKSIAVRLTFRDLNKTLTDKKVNAIIDKITRRLQQEFSGEIR
ncbi:MAG: phenylalanine--tRNA ligase subunit beta [Deltaproteobacteria bacterium]|nr:phenylalanine--tRNA ligase subunit beta [Deltaproteobacteria bacterium]